MKETQQNGLVILSVAIIVSSIILAVALHQVSTIISSSQSVIQGSLNGSLTLDDSSRFTDSDIMQVYQAAELLGYGDTNDSFILDILNGKFQDIPYTKMGRTYIFSRVALEEWVYQRAIGNVVD